MTPHRRPVIAIAVVTLVDCVIAAAWYVSAASWAAVATFTLMAAGAFWAIVDASRRLRSESLPYGAPARHLVAPAAVAAGSVAIVLVVGASMSGLSRVARPLRVEE